MYVKKEAYMYAHMWQNTYGSTYIRTYTHNAFKLDRYIRTYAHSTYIHSYTNYSTCTSHWRDPAQLTHLT